MNVEYSSITDLSKRFETAARIAPRAASRFLVKQVAEPMVTEMRSDAPVDTGELRDSIRYIQSSDLKVVIGSFGVGHAVFVNEGTRPHVIRAKGAALTFTIQGRRVFAKSVQHPGTEPNPFMNRARDKTLRRAAPRLAGVLMEDFKHERT